MTARRVARVLIDSPLPQLDRLFDYADPGRARRRRAARASASRCRCAAPAASSTATSSSWASRMPRTGRSPSSTRSSRRCRCSRPALYALARRAADRAAGSASDILRLAIPKRMVRAEKAWLAARAAVPRPSVDDAERATGRMRRFAAYPGLGEASTAADERLAVDAPPRPSGCRTAERPARGRCCSPPPRCARSRAGRSAILVVPDHRDQAQLEAALAGRVAGRGRRPRRRAADLAGALRRVPAHARAGAVHRRRQSLRGLRAGARTRADRDLGRRRPAARRAAQPRGARARRRAHPPGARRLRAACSRATPARPTSSGSSRWAGCARSPPARRASPRVVLSATREGESRGARVPSAAFAAAREALADRTRARAGRPARVRARCSCAPSAGTPARCPHCGGPLHAARRGRGARVRLVRPARPPAGRARDCTSTRVRMASSGSERTADELGRAFPGIRIIVADGEHPVPHVDATPGARRRDTRRRADRRRAATAPSSSSTAIGCCWPTTCGSASRACAGGRTPPRSPRPGAPVHLVGVAGPVARALATWTQPAYARAELADRAPLRMPPTVRVAALEGDRRAVDAALSALRDAVPALDDGRRVLGPVPTGDERRACARALRLRARRDGGGEPARVGRRRGAARRTRRPHRAAQGSRTSTRRAQYTQSAGRRARSRPVRNAMRLVFAGTPDAAVPSLRLLAASDHDIAAVVTRRDAPLGRKRVLTPSPVAAAARGARHRHDPRPTGWMPRPPTRIAALEPDLGVIVAYGGLVREPLLSTPGARLDQPALLAAAALAGRRAGAARPDRRRRQHRRGGVPARRPRSTRATSSREREYRVPTARPPGTCSPRWPTRAPSCCAMSSTRSPPAPRDADTAGRASRRSPRSSATRTAASAGTSRATRCSARIRGVTPEPGAHTTVDGARLKLLAASAGADDAPRLEPGEIALHGRAVLVGTATRPGRARAGAARGQGRDGRRRLVARRRAPRPPVAGS